jgi:hypothetical protein
MRAVREVLVEGPGSLGEQRRQRRWGMLSAVFPEIADMRVLDLGGTPETWIRSPLRPAHVVVLNLSCLPVPAQAWIEVHAGDACAPPKALRSRSFDLVYSNSLIEHVGGDARCRQLVEVVASSAERHWVQTPYRYFPIEPHWLFPGMQFFPVSARALVAQYWPLAHARARTKAAAVRSVLAVELLSYTALAHYFPQSTIVRERVGALTKSLIAIAGGEPCWDAAGRGVI